MSKLALKLIAENKITKAPFLDLGNCGLRKFLPVELIDCDWLIRLNLGQYYYDEVNDLWCDSINQGNENVFQGKELFILQQLINLRKLDLNFIYINDIKFLEKLTFLQSLDLSNNHILNLQILEKLHELQTLFLDSIHIKSYNFLEKIINLKKLSIRKNQITDTSFLENLYNLQSLDISDNHISDTFSVGKLNNLEDLNLNKNVITVPILENLTNLKKLGLNNNYITELQFLEKLNNLQSLDLSFNKIIDYQALKKINRLQKLDLNGNYITNISFLENSQKLQILLLNTNKISNVDFLGDMKDLRRLDLSYNKINKINFTGKNIFLQELLLGGNQIVDASFLANVPNLQILNLSENQILQIDFLKEMVNLKELILRSNRITEIHFLEDLKNLAILDISENRIKDIDCLKKLKKLQSVDLKKNQIIEFDALLHLLKNKLQIDFSGKFIWQLERQIGIVSNPIANPPIEIVKRGTKAILNWFDERDEQGEEIVYEAKLMIIGDAGSGKTSLSSKIKNTKSMLPNKVDDTTVGIDISEFKFDKKENKPEFKVNIWDLGGQKIYHPLHQLFFSRRSLYVLVVNGREENDLDDFWIPVQELLGKDSPMLILFNQHGKIQSSIPFRNLKANYPNIKGDLSIVDLLNNEDKTKDFISEIEKSLRNLPQFEKGEKLPKLWVRIREAIAQKKENYIDLKDFRNLCSEIGISDQKKQDFVSDYLHDLGIILRFRDDALLNKIVFLKPQWALDAIYRVLDHTREHQNGLFRKEDLLCVWDNQEFYDAQDELLALMKKFELCYEIDCEQYLVPSLLPEDLPNDFEWDKSNNITLHYEYDFMPKGIISRLIVRLHHLIAKDKLLWREGVIFEYQGATVWLTKFANKRIELYAKGYKPSSLITIITNEIDEINSKYQFSERSKPKKKIPCICEICNGKLNSTYYSYDDLVLRDINGKRTVECTQVPFLEVNVKDLLENVENQSVINIKSKNSELIKMETIKIFVTYCWTDKEENFDKEHQKKVRGFVDELINYEEFDATFDLYENEKSTSINFMRMMYENIVKSKKVIIALSEGYTQKADDFKINGVMTEYQAIMNDIQANPRKYILVSFDKRSGEIYPFGLQGTDTIVIKNGNLELAENEEDMNRLFAKLKDEAIYEMPVKGTKKAVVKKK